MLRSVLVYGPPCGGKNTYVEANRHSRDLVLDLDALALAIAPGCDPTDKSPVVLAACKAMKDSALESFRGCNATEGAPVLWVIACAPYMRERSLMRNWYNSELVLMNPGKPICLERAVRRYGVRSFGVVCRWFDEYEEG